MDLPEGLSFEKLSPEDKYYRAVPGYMKRLADIYEAIHERFGEEGLDLIREVSKEYGTRIGRNVQKRGARQNTGRYTRLPDWKFNPQGGWDVRAYPE